MGVIEKIEFGIREGVNTGALKFDLYLSSFLCLHLLFIPSDSYYLTFSQFPALLFAFFFK